MGPSVGRSREQRFSGRRPLRSCQDRVAEDNVVLIDEESDNIENVVVIDIPDSTPIKVGGGSERLKRGKKAATSWTGVICLDDDDEDKDDEFDGDCVMNGGNVKNGCSSSRKSNSPTSANFGSSSAANQENVSPLKLSKGKRTYSGKTASGTRFGIYDIDELSGDDIPDCELMEDQCGSVKEMWEKAYTKRKWDSRDGQAAQSFDFSGCYSSHFSEPGTSGMPSMEEQKLKEPSSFPCQGKDTEQVKHANKHTHDNSEVPLRDSCRSQSESRAKENVCVSEKNSSRRSSLHNQSVDSELGHGRFCSPDQNGSFPEKTCSPLQKDPKCMNNSHEMKSSHQEASFSNTSSSHQHTAKNSVCIDEMSIPNNPNLHNDETNDPEHGEDDECVMVGDREKLKETEEYKKAVEEELASRQRALQIQAEEAQNLRRARKRMKAESMRILDMEKRQKQRLEEIRETDKKDQENSNLRDIIRAEVRRDLSILEMTCFDMASLLRALGIPIPIGDNLLPPSLNEVRVAYKKALLAFHPDRASRSDIRQQVEAEEKFKLISRMKEKFLPSL